MKIICVGYLHGAGGAERQITMLANELAERGHDVTLAVLAENNGKYTLSDKVAVVDLTSAESRKGMKIGLRYSALLQLYRSIRPDVTIHFWLQSAYLTACMPRNITGKTVYAERGDPGDTEYRGALGIIRKLSFCRIDGFVFQSEGARDYFDRKVREKSTVIHNAVAVAPEQFLHKSTCREPRIVNVGRLHEQKNQQLLINAFSKVREKHPMYTLEIYGDGQLKEKLAKYAESIEVGDAVFFFPSCKDIFSRIFNAQMFVLSSTYEGMPNALMEAMALGVPCISTDCRPGGARTLIENYRNGIIVPLGDADLLAEAMLFMIEQKDKAEVMAANAQHIKDTHSKEIIYQKWIEYLTNIVEEKKHHA